MTVGRVQRESGSRRTQIRTGVHNPVHSQHSRVLVLSSDAAFRLIEADRFSLAARDARGAQKASARRSAAKISKRDPHHIPHAAVLLSVPGRARACYVVLWGGTTMSRSLTPFKLGDVITGDPHLYVTSPPARPLDSAVETDQTSASNEPHWFERCAAAVLRLFRMGPTPEDALAASPGKTFRP